MTRTPDTDDDLPRVELDDGLAPDWQAKVWQRIEREGIRPSYPRWTWTDAAWAVPGIAVAPGVLLAILWSLL